MKYSLPTKLSVYVSAFVVITLFSSSLPRAETYEDIAALEKISDQRKLSSFLEATYQQSLDNGIVNNIPGALFLIKESRLALAGRNYERAGILAAYAQKLAPDIPAGYRARGEAQWSKNRLFINYLLIGYAEAFIREVSLKNMDGLCFFAGKNLAVITGAFLLTLLVVAVISLIKYFSLAAHDLRHTIAPVVPDVVVLGILLVLLCLPLFLGLSIFWLSFYWLVLLFAYHSTGERITITVLLLGCSVVIPVLIASMAFSISVPRSNLISLLWKANYGTGNQQNIENLETLLETHNDDQDILFSLGLINKKEGSYRTAQKYYEKLLKNNPRSYKALTNLGNVYLATQRWNEAVAHYEQAISTAPSLSAAAHFNLARAYQQKFMFKEAEKELDEAKKIDRSTVDWNLKMYSENYNRLLIDETVSMQRLWKRSYELFTDNPQDIKDIWDLTFRGIPLPYGPVAMLVIFFLNAALGKKDQFHLASKCKMCGKAVCRRCQRSVSAEIMCYQCQNFLKKQDTLGYKLKEEKVSSIKAYLKFDKTTGTVLGWIFPGAGQLWKQQPAKGTACLFIFFLLLLKTVSILVVEGSWDFMGFTNTPVIIPLVVIMVVLWLLLAADAQRLRQKRLEDNILLKSISMDR